MSWKLGKWKNWKNIQKSPKRSFPRKKFPDKELKKVFFLNIHQKIRLPSDIFNLEFEIIFLWIKWHPEFFQSWNKENLFLKFYFLFILFWLRFPRTCQKHHFLYFIWFEEFLTPLPRKLRVIFFSIPLILKNIFCFAWKFLFKKRNEKRKDWDWISWGKWGNFFLIEFCQILFLYVG